MVWHIPCIKDKHKTCMEVKMKQLIVFSIALMLLIIPALLSAQEEVILEKGQKKIIIQTNKDLQNLEELKKMQINMTMGKMKEESPDAPFFGIYPAEMSFAKAQELNYPNTYGVLITGIVPNSPAYQYRLAEDDVLMEIDGKKVLNTRELDKIKSLYRAGDAVNLKVFRAGEVLSIDFVFGSPTRKEIPTGIEKITLAKKLSPGYGGGSWIPLWYNADMEDVNELIAAIGYSKLPEDGILTHGIAGKFNVGKGWFIGGQFQFYGDSKKINVEDNYVNTMDYNLFIGGATLDKRIPVTRGIVTSLGLMIGGASHSIDLVHSNGNYNWPQADQTTQTTQYIMGGNTYANISKGYILVQPRAELMVRLLSWLALRGEAGFIYGYGPTSGWKVYHTESESYELKNSPNTPFKGYTITVGPWFGF